MSAQILTSKFGAELQSFKIDDEEKLHQGEECLDENGKVYWNRRFELLFPTVGKCKQNQTIINGKNYEMQINGFAKDLDFEPITRLDNYHSYIFKTKGRLREKFPFDFSLIVTYRLNENKLTTKYKVVNESDMDMPFGIGSRPALKIDPNELEKGNYYLEFEEDEDKIHFLYLVDGLVATDYAKNIVLINKKQILLNSNSFKNDALIIKGIKSRKISLKNKNMEKPVFTVDFGDFPYLAIWSKPKAPFICIEPWMTTPDNVNGTGVFRQKNNILLLPPKKEFECKYSIEFF